MTNAVLTLTKALDFAARKHTDHRRKGVREEPYINHLAEVHRPVPASHGLRHASQSVPWRVGRMGSPRRVSIRPRHPHIYSVPRHN